MWHRRHHTDVVVVPGLLEIAQEVSAAGAVACQVFEPVRNVETTQDRIKVGVQIMSTHGAELSDIEVRLSHANIAWKSAAPYVDQSRLLRPYQDQLHRFGDRLPDAVRLVGYAGQMAPHLPWLLGLDTERRFLIVSQNPFELRATGGFIGIVCVLRVTQGNPAFDGCQSSDTYDTPAPDSVAIPFPYSRYLRLSKWYLRDANWSADFPTTASRLQWFWKLNNQPEVDGVIAVDPFALVPLLEVTGPFELNGGTKIDADGVVDEILRTYYSSATDYPEKAHLTQLIPGLITHLQQLDVQRLPNLLGAVRQIVVERHLQLATNHPQLQSLLTKSGWDGGFYKVAGDVLRVVDADVGYGDVNGFIDRLTHYDVAMSDAGVPLSSTLTLTYTNRYSAWAEAQTSQWVFGNCTDPTTLRLEAIHGCYANYVRIYVPEGSEIITSSGFEESFDPGVDYGRTIFGGYFRVLPGEQRVIQIVYRLPSISPDFLYIEKQPGTLAPPLLITAHTSRARAAL